MDRAIQEMQKKIDWIQGDPALLRSYLRYEKAASDEITRIYGAKREGKIEGLREGKIEGKIEGLREGKIEGKIEGLREGKLAIAQKMKNRGLPVDQITELTGLSIEEITNL